MKKIYVLILAIVFLGCGPKEKNTIPEGYTLQPVNFLNKKTHLPSVFKKVNLNEISEMLRQNPDLNPIDQFHLKQAVALQNNSPVAPVLFQDSINKSNVIWFTKDSYIPVDKELAISYVNMLENSLLPNQNNSGFTYEKLEGKYMVINGFQCIKVKYKVSYGDKAVYSTQYIATRDLETTMIASTNAENLDFNYLLKNLR